MFNWDRVEFYTRIAISLLFFVVLPAYIFYLNSPYRIINSKRVGDYKVGQSCAPKVIPALLKENLVPTIDVACQIIDSFSYGANKAIKLRITYSTEMRGDIGGFKNVEAVQLPSGEITFDERYLALKDTIHAEASRFALQSIQSLPSLKSNFLELVEEVFGPNGEGKFCAVYKGIIPLSGVVTTCMEPGGEPSSFGNMEWDPSIPSFEELSAIAFDYASSTFPRKLYEPTYGKELAKVPYHVELYDYNHTEGFWVFAVENGYPNSYRFIKFKVGEEPSCTRSYGNLGSGCP